MYVILAILYESYVHPLTVLSTLPTALVGGLLTLYIFGEQASLYAFVGMFMLMGIVKKNGIMIVDFARQRVDAGETAENAIHEASMDRFRPILMTTLAAVIGAVPIAAGYGADGASRAAAGDGDRRRPGGFAIHHAVCDAGDLSVPRAVPGKSAGPHIVLPFGTHADTFRGRANRGSRWRGGLSGAGFSLRGLVLARTEIHRLKPASPIAEPMFNKRIFVHPREAFVSLMAVCALAVFLAGCTVGPNYKRPNTDVPTAFRGATPAEAASPTAASLGDQKWWEVFQDEELQKLIRTRATTEL